MTAPRETFDPPAAAARRQWVLDRYVEHLVEWGAPLDYATARAATLLAVATDAGYALSPAIAERVTPRGPGSTAAARLDALRQAHAAVEAARRRHQTGLEATNTPPPVSPYPPERPGAAEGVAP